MKIPLLQLADDTRASNVIPARGFRAIRRGWCLGADAFRKEILESVHTRATESRLPETRRERTEEKARRILQVELDMLDWAGAELAGDARKHQIARRPRTETSVTLKWIAPGLHAGTWTRVANRLQPA